MSKPIVGAQLFTVRDYVKDIPGIVETFRKVREIGYTAVQISGFGKVDPDELVKAIIDSGLDIASSHTSWNRFQNDLDGVIAEHKAWKSTHLAIGGVPNEYRNLEGIKRFIDEVIPIAEQLAEEGMDFSYHNHNWELAKFNGTPWLSALYDQASPEHLKAELDVYWIQAGGGDPTEWVTRCSGREPLVHLKDMCVTQDREQRFAEIGEGNLNWPAILKAATDGGAKYVLVEQDHCYDRNPFESLALSYENLKALGYE